MPLKELEKVDEGVEKLLTSKNNRRNLNKFIDWFIRRYYSDELKELKGDADSIRFTRISFDAETFVEIEYITYNEA